jgi:hypothetical protein
MSCNNAKKNTTSEKIKMPDSLSVFYKGDITTFDKNRINGLSLITSINTSCATCLYELDQWLDFEKLNKNEDLEFMIICHSKDNFEMFRYLYENGDIPALNVPIYLDMSNTFMSLNRGFLNEEKKITVLTDKNYNVILNGSPFLDTALKQSYMSHFK